MSKRGRLSRDQKRKQKLARERKSHEQVVGPYEGRKYQAPQFADALMRAEVGILESYVLSGRRLTDRQVEAALQHLILELRGQTPAEPPESAFETEGVDGQREDLVVARIKDNWADLFADQPRHSAADLTGILRTIWSSVGARSYPGPDSQGYLKFIEGFLGRLGVRTQRLRPDEVPGGVEGKELPEENSPYTG
jgi:hypothetical protein